MALALVGLFRLRRARHERRLSSAVHAPRVRLPAMAGKHHCRPRDAALCEEAPAFWFAVHRTTTTTPTATTTRTAHCAVSVAPCRLAARQERRLLNRYTVIDRYARDLKRDPFHAWLIKHARTGSACVSFSHHGCCFRRGLRCHALSWAHGLSEAALFGLSLMVWGGAVANGVGVAPAPGSSIPRPTCGAIEITRPATTAATTPGPCIFCNGDGWHNNHHADPASHGTATGGGNSIYPG